ncbi:MAG TPA: sugar ABC transporter ATP-binding protein [Vicinamibacterales bacterium]|nr:sugar ABC transporter ATP-binding protein [Vicinamibacterales bacterium]
MPASGSVPERGPLLAVEGVVKRFGGHTALGGVSLSIAAGEIVALAGENGAGKSTLMAVCSGALAPDEGGLRWQGHAVRFTSTADARDAGIAIVHQEPQLVGCLSVAENLVLGQMPRRAGGLVDWPAVERTATEALARVGLSLPLRVPIASLGPGVRQLVAIARAVHGGARLLILDEPTSSLALDDARRLAEIVREIAARGTAVIYISHRVEELRPLAERLVVLRDGRVTLDAPLASVAPKEFWAALSGGAEEAAASAPAAEPPATSGTASRPDLLLDVRGLRQHNRLRDVTVQVASGEIVGLAGLVGSGRSRLLHAIFGCEKADGGSVQVRVGPALRDVRTIDQAIAAGIGLVPEDRRRQGLVLGATISDNIALAIPGDSVSKGLLRRRRILDVARAALDRLRIRARGVVQPVIELSGGNQQKVLLARWLRSGTRVLLLDEPTRGVDVVAKAEIHQFLREAAAGGMGLLVASSDLPELLALCDRIYVMRSGAVAGEVRAADADPTRLLTMASGAAA